MSFPYTLAVHGGAGVLASLSEEKQKQYLAGMEAALRLGEQLLKCGASSLDAVEACVKLLEDDPTFNAGRGSVLDENGTVNMDAGIMDGKTLAAGSIAGVKRVKNPIALARLVMEKSEHVMLISEGAEAFGRVAGAPFEPESYFITEQRIKGLEEAKQKERVVLDHDSVVSAPAPMSDKKMGTVGAVAFDKAGNLAAATSTGGITNKKFGRVGDSPIIGAGVYADNETCAVSATGYGEQFIRCVISKTLADFVFFKGMTAQEASDAALEYLVAKVKGLGGFIVIDRHGRFGCSFSTDGMIRAWVKEGEEARATLWK